jgi:hypothetical protein
MSKREMELAGQDPEELLRALLKVSPEDAAKVREAANTKAERKPPSDPMGDASSL